MNFMKILLYNNNFFNDLKFSKLVKSALTLKVKNNIKDIFTNIRNIGMHFSLNKLTSIKLLYFNRNIIHPLLYEFDNIINLNSKKVDNISYYFYLSLLIANNPNVIFYYYSIEFIKNINENSINSNNNIKRLIISKIIIDLIKYYRGLEGYGNNLDELIKIEEYNIKVIKNSINKLDLNLKIKEIKSKTIEEIYLEIIISLIKNKFENFEYIEYIIKQLDFESINLTQIMFNEIKTLLDNKENDIRQYLISKEDDLFDNKKINLYYILLKYIFKEQIYIYQINFFLETRKFIIKLIKSNSNCFEIYNIDNKMEYIIGKITDSKYYMMKYDETKNSKNNKDDHKVLNENSSSFLNNTLEKNNSLPNVEEEEKYNYLPNNIDTTEIKYNYLSNNTDTAEVKDSYLSNNTDTAEVKNEKEREENEMRYISQILKKYFLTKIKSIIGDHKNKKNQKNEIKKYTADFIIETNNFFISGGTNNEIIAYNKDLSFETKIKIPFTDWVYNILENKVRDDIKDNYMLVTQGKQIALLKVIIEIKGFSIYSKLIMNSLFSLKIGEDFLVCCQNKVVKYSSNLIQRNLLSQEEVLKDNYTAKGAIRINNFVLLKSNKICSMGNDDLFIFNIITHEIFTFKNKDEYSLIYSQNGLTILTMNIKKEKNGKFCNKNILLCACKKYIKKQKNGILLLTGFDENTKCFEIETYFFDTKNFEVYCFCPLLIIDTNNIINKNKIINTNYFLVGGFEKSKNKGIIKLFKVIYNNENSDSRIEFIQDIEIIDKYDSNKFIFKIFKKPISCIIQSSSTKNLLITCWDGNVYSLEALNIESYLKFDELLEKKISFKEFNDFAFLSN